MDLITKDVLKAAFFPAERIAIFVDGANMHGAVRDLDFTIDYAEVRKHFGDCGRLMRSYYYTAIKEDTYDGVRKFADWLDNNNWNVVSKAVKFQGPPGGEDYVMKANMDVEIAVDMLKHGAYVDHLVLFSGDGDFRYLLEALKDRGKRITVVSTPKSIAAELRREADNYFELEALRGLLAKDPKTRMRAMLDKPPRVEPSVQD